jgi:hypothetical protein
MKRATHTPGPWVVRRDNWHVNIETEDGSHWLADLPFEGSVPNARDMADAHLIAAAPELLDMLIRIADAEFGTGCWPDGDEIQELIEKAGGT